jgi:hypothetical protein
VRAARGDGVQVDLHNLTDRLAFFVQLRLIDATGADVLPVVWSDNYVSLFPGDARTLRAVVPGGALPPDIQVEVRGLNVPPTMVAAEPDGARPAIGGGVPELVLDDDRGPAANLGRDQSERLISTIVDIALDPRYR